MKAAEILWFGHQVDGFESDVARRLRAIRAELIGHEVVYTSRYAPHDKKAGRKAVIFDVWMSAAGTIMCDISFLTADGSAYLVAWSGGYTFDYLSLTGRRVFDTIVGQTRPNRGQRQ